MQIKIACESIQGAIESYSCVAGLNKSPRPVWPDLAKFRHFGTILKVLGAFLMAQLVFGKILMLLLLKFFTIGQVFIVVDGQIL